MMLDHVFVEGVGGEIALGRLEFQLFLRREPQEIALAAAMRAVAFHQLLDLAFDFEGDLSAMTGAFVGHGPSKLFALSSSGDSRS